MPCLTDYVPKPQKATSYLHNLPTEHPSYKVQQDVHLSSEALSDYSNISLTLSDNILIRTEILHNQSYMFNFVLKSLISVCLSNLQATIQTA